MADILSVVRSAADTWNTHDRDAYIAFYRPDVALHGFPEGVTDAETLGDFFAGLWAGVSDARVTVEDGFEAGDRAAIRLTVSGTHDGELMGVPATHRPISFDVLTIIRMQDGKIAERWNVADFLTMMQQIGAVPAAA